MFKRPLTLRSVKEAKIDTRGIWVAAPLHKPLYASEYQDALTAAPHPEKNEREQILQYSSPTNSISNMISTSKPHGYAGGYGIRTVPMYGIRPSYGQDQRLQLLHSGACSDPDVISGPLTMQEIESFLPDVFLLYTDFLTIGNITRSSAFCGFFLDAQRKATEGICAPVIRHSCRSSVGWFHFELSTCSARSRKLHVQGLTMPA